MEGGGDSPGDGVGLLVDVAATKGQSKAKTQRARAREKEIQS